MSNQMKMQFIQEYVIYNCYCIWDLFWENVTNDSISVFKSKVEKATTEKELKRIVHEYI